MQATTGKTYDEVVALIQRSTTVDLTVSRRSAAPADPGASFLGVTRATPAEPPTRQEEFAPAPAAVESMPSPRVDVAARAVVADVAPTQPTDGARQRRRSSVGRTVAVVNDSETEEIEVTLTRPNLKSSYGFTLAATEGDVYHIVTAISDNGLAVGELFIGDKIIAINGEETSGHTHQEVVGMITRVTQAHFVVARSLDGVGTLAPTIRARIAKRTASVGRRSGQFNGVVGGGPAASASVPVPIEVVINRKTVQDR